jgi:Flp pilus assembly protein TadG
MIRFCRRRGTARGRRGTAAVEFAVLAPLLAALVMGGMEAGRALMAKVVLNDAARKACRAAILPTGSNSTVNSEVSDILQTNHGITFNSNMVTVQVNGTTADASTAKQNDRVSVKVAVAYSQFAWAPTFFLSNTTLESDTVVMMRQR